MFEFVCDPLVEDVPLVGEGTLAVAVRVHAGAAVRWVPGGDVGALAEFLGWVATTDGQLLKADGGGGFVPVDLSVPQVWVKPPAGDPFLVPVESFTGRFAVPRLVKAGLSVTVESVETVPAPAEMVSMGSVPDDVIAALEAQLKDEPGLAYPGEAVEQVPQAAPAEDAGVAGDTSSASASENDGLFACDVCGKVYETEHGRKIHRARQHG